MASRTVDEVMDRAAGEEIWRRLQCLGIGEGHGEWERIGVSESEGRGGCFVLEERRRHWYQQVIICLEQKNWNL